MSVIQSTHEGARQANGPLTTPMLFLLATGAGLAVAALYYSQPMLGVLGADIGADGTTMGFLPTLTQLGYALGLVFLAPLGDRFDRRRIILVKASLLVLALLTAALAPSIAFLLAASLLIGLTATLAQDIVPAAAELSQPQHRGRSVGTVMTGLLLGILLSRVVSGLVAENFGWRTMFLAAALSIAALSLALWRGLPRFVPTTQLSYAALLGSLATLWRRYPKLRRAAIAQGLLSIGFSAFWSTLAVMLHDAPFHLGAAAAGAFGLAGAAGALAAPLAGRVADRHGPERVARFGAALALLSFAAMLALPVVPPGAQLAIIALSALGFDMAVQISLISHQTIIYAVDPPARSRLNAVLMASVFIGMAVGATLGSLALARWGWMGVTGVATLAALGALLTRQWPAAEAG